mmetsp:Transcript_21860/g.47653  ORF Transcript_21860/g.47653 Transcript_21860/m.47653 type:complete len:461 (+) Transcript_21860:141-1523(+)
MSQEHQEYIQTKVNPILENLVTQVLLERPENPVPFMVRWLASQSPQAKEYFAGAGVGEAEKLKTEVKKLQEEVRELQLKLGQKDGAAAVAHASADTSQAKEERKEIAAADKKEEKAEEEMEKDKEKEREREVEKEREKSPDIEQEQERQRARDKDEAKVQNEAEEKSKEKELPREQEKAKSPSGEETPREEETPSIEETTSGEDTTSSEETPSGEETPSVEETNSGEDATTTSGEDTTSGQHTPRRKKYSEVFLDITCIESNVHFTRFRKRQKAFRNVFSEVRRTVEGYFGANGVLAFDAYIHLLKAFAAKLPGSALTGFQATCIGLFTLQIGHFKLKPTYSLALSFFEGFLRFCIFFYGDSPHSWNFSYRQYAIDLSHGGRWISRQCWGWRSELYFMAAEESMKCPFDERVNVAHSLDPTLVSQEANSLLQRSFTSHHPLFAKGAGGGGGRPARDGGDD